MRKEVAESYMLNGNGVQKELFFNSAKFFNNAKNQLEFTKETRFARYLSKFSLIFGIKKKFGFA